MSIFGGYCAIGQTADVGVVRSARRKADDNHHQNTDDEDENTIVLEKRFIDYPEKAARGIAVFKSGHFQSNRGINQ